MLENFYNIPEELRLLKQWCVWRYEETESGKPTKVPYKPDGYHCSVTDSATWCTFDEVVTACKWSSGKLAGIGFVFAKGGEYAGIDLDAAPDEITSQRQQKIFAAFDSYAERSPSGKGLHIIIKANLPSGRRRSSIELYSSDRFFTMTGDVFNNKPITLKQELAEILYEELGKVKNISNYLGTVEENSPDEMIINQALKAVNGDKFKTLLEGKWQDLYPSQSEADLSFMNMIAFYTHSRNQIVRIFRNSPLSNRDKANRSDYIEYMLNKVFDQVLPHVDIEGLQEAFDTAKAKHLNKQAPEVFEAPEDSPYKLPPGLLGEVAQFIYQCSPRQVPEIALAAAIAFMAGITGRAYNISGTGLNQYVLLLAPTGTGKEGMASGIDKLVAAIRDEVPAIKDFIGPAEIVSGQALLKYVSNTSSSFVSVVGEFGLKMQQLSNRHANTAEIMLKRVLLDIYNKSGHGKQLQPAIYSQKENTTQMVNSPAVTILGESTPETFFQSIDENIIADGLLPRFTLIEYNGIRPDLNYNHGFAAPSDSLKDRLATLVAHCLRLNNGVNNTPMCVNVGSTDAASKILHEYDIYATAKINGSDVNVIRHLWNRAHIKVLKLAALIAVGCDAYNPIIQTAYAEWAIRVVNHDVSKLYTRFATGNFGADENETKQLEYVKNAFKNYLNSNFAQIKMYSHNEELHRAKVVPYSYLSKKLISAAPFRLDRIGSTNAIKKALVNLVDSGSIKEIGKLELNTTYKTSQKAFIVADMAWLWN